MWSDRVGLTLLSIPSFPHKSTQIESLPAFKSPQLRYKLLKNVCKNTHPDLLRRKWNRQAQQRRLPTAIKLTIEREHETLFLSSKQLKIYSSGKVGDCDKRKSIFPDRLLFLIGGAYARLRREATKPYKRTTLSVQFSEPQLSSRNSFPFPIMHRKAWKVSENNCKSFKHRRRNEPFTNHCDSF